MRNFINIVEHNHPHARGEDEWFKFMFVYMMNVDEARRMIQSGEISTKEATYSVKDFAVRGLGAKANDFGSRNYEPRTSFSLFAEPPVDYALIPTIPEDRVNEDPLCVFWNSMAMANALGEDTEGLTEGSALTVIDGNHRIMRRFLEGDEGTVTIQVVTEPEDIAKFTYRNGVKLINQMQ